MKMEGELAPPNEPCFLADDFSHVAEDMAMSKREEPTIDGGDDRLSNLPDDALTSILVFLDAKEIVQTCLLSKRWCNLWTFVPCLDFDDHGFIDEATKELEGENLERFQNFVSSFLHLRDDSTDLLVFKLSHRISPYSMSWIRYVVRHNPKYLFIVLYGKDRLDLTYCSSIFTCDSLKRLYLHLDLSGVVEVIIPDNVFLPKLREMHFLFVIMRGDNLEKFLSGCPVLESLKLDSYVPNMDCISFQTVKELDITIGHFVNELCPPVFSIFAPHLEWLKFSGCYLGAVKFKDMSKIKNAIIHNFLESSTFVDKYEYLSSFSSIEDLEIYDSYYLKEKLQAELNNCPIFHNLKNLSSGFGCFHCVFDVLFSFLKHCPNLEHLLTLHHFECCEEPEADDNLDRIKSFDCKRLRLILFKHYGARNMDLVVKLLERSTMKIENVQIISEGGPLNTDDSPSPSP